MSKDGSNKDHKVEGAKLVGSPKKMISLLVSGSKENDWATDLLINHRSEHKQVLTAMLLNRLYKLVQTTEKTTGAKFAMQEGYEFSIAKNKVLPVLIPINQGAPADDGKIMKSISHIPEHEALAFAIYMQAIEWAIKSLDENSTA